MDTLPALSCRSVLTTARMKHTLAHHATFRQHSIGAPLSRTLHQTISRCTRERREGFQNTTLAAGGGRLSLCTSPPAKKHTQQRSHHPEQHVWVSRSPFPGKRRVCFGCAGDRVVRPALRGDFVLHSALISHLLFYSIYYLLSAAAPLASLRVSLSAAALRRPTPPIALRLAAAARRRRQRRASHDINPLVASRAW